MKSPQGPRWARAGPLRYRASYEGMVLSGCNCAIRSGKRQRCARIATGKPWLSGGCDLASVVTRDFARTNPIAVDSARGQVWGLLCMH